MRRRQLWRRAASAASAAWLLFASALCAPPAQGADPEVDRLLKEIESEFADVKTVQARFVQEKRLAVFDQAVVLEGELALENPGRLAWRVTRPVRYTMVLADDVIRQWDEDSNQVQKIALSGNPVFKVVSRQLQVWFSGKYASLADDYEITRPPGDAIALAFVPRKDSMAGKAVKRVTVTFRSDRRYIRGILIEDVSGDRTEVTFADTTLNAPISKDTWEVRPRD